MFHDYRQHKIKDGDFRVLIVTKTSEISFGLIKSLKKL